MTVTAAADTRPEAVRVSEVLGALSFALDLTEGRPMGHALRTCLVGMEIADRLDLALADRRDLYYALLLKDVGCSSSSARVFALFGGDERPGRRRPMDVGGYLKALRFGLAYAAPGASWFERARRVAALAGRGARVANQLVGVRAERGAEIVLRLGFGPRAAAAVRSLDERWDGGGHPRGASRTEIPLLSRIIGLAQALEVFTTVDGPHAALRAARDRSGRRFDPTLVQASRGMEPELSRWRALDEERLRRAVTEREPGGASLLAGPGTLDRIALGFADIVDAKSPFTASHSFRVTEIALGIASRLGQGAGEMAALRRAALLHDIGKLSVPNAILDKPAPLTADEWETVRLHSYYTQRILAHVRGLERMAFIAASHHERLDGRGYFRGLRGEQVPREARILAVADVYDALSAARPYRPPLPEEIALRLMEKDRGIGLWGECVDALAEAVRGGDERAADGLTA